MVDGSGVSGLMSSSRAVSSLPASMQIAPIACLTDALRSTANAPSLRSSRRYRVPSAFHVTLRCDAAQSGVSRKQKQS